MEMDSLGVADLMLRRLEGLRLAPYQDVAGLWTIGYGNRCLADGTPVMATTRPITEAAALALLTGTVATLRGKLRGLVHVPLSACQEGAVLSWQYNVGTAAAASSTLLRMLNAGRFEDASAQFPVWNKVRDPRTGRLVVSSGLVNRREIERAAFLGRLPAVPWDSKGPSRLPATPWDSTGPSRLPAAPWVSAGPSPSGSASATPHLSTDSLNAAELARVKG